MARQRVDNFAAGFIKAGAAAVVAEAYASPNHMVRTVLAGQRSIEAAWRGAPTANGTTPSRSRARAATGTWRRWIPSGPTPGSRARSSSRRAWLRRTSCATRAAAHWVPPPRSQPRPPRPLVPTLAGTGIEIGVPSFQGSTAAGGKINYRIPFKIADRDKLPKKLQASARWDLIEAAVDLAPRRRRKRTGPRPRGRRRRTSDSITAERIGDVIAPAKLKIGQGQMAVHVATPAAPGRYRLTVTLHDEDGVAYDPVTQAQVPSLIFRVTGDLDAGFDAPAALDLAPGATADLSGAGRQPRAADLGPCRLRRPPRSRGQRSRRERPDDRDVGRPRCR